MPYSCVLREIVVVRIQLLVNFDMVGQNSVISPKEWSVGFKSCEDGGGRSLYSDY